jgi:hypothetical protein
MREIDMRISQLGIFTAGFALMIADAQAQTLPQGTILAWRPPFDAIDKVNGAIVFPKGWRQCDFGGPKPEARYLKGVAAKDYAMLFNSQDPTQEKLRGGSETHFHTARTGVSTLSHRKYHEDQQTVAADPDHRHEVTVDPTPNDPPYAAVIWLCAKGDQAVASFHSFGYGGNAITIARQGKTLAGEVPRSYAVCNESDRPAQVAFGPVGARQPSAPRNLGTIGKGECFGIDRPAFLRVNNAASDGVVHGIYYALRQGTFPKAGIRFKPGEPTAPISQTAARIPAYDVEERPFGCKQLPDASPLRKEFYAQCDLSLSRKGNYRLCFSDDHLVGAPENFAFGGQRLIVDRKLLSTGFIPPGNSSAFSRSSCIDLWDVDTAVALIWPPTAGDVHDPAKITAVKASVQTIGYQDDAGSK